MNYAKIMLKLLEGVLFAYHEFYQNAQWLGPEPKEVKNAYRKISEVEESLRLYVFKNN